MGRAQAARHTDLLSIHNWYDDNIIDMETVTISPKFQVVIPKSVRERLKLRAGQLVQAIAYDDRIELVPLRPARSLRGALKGLDTAVLRERDRE
jgi:AbrB family looped-hinge helix DNA binding protein